MRQSFKKITQIWLKIIAKVIISKYQPQIIAISGSYGKTSAKEAIFTVLDKLSSKRIRKSEGNLNSQWGLPLTIIGMPDPAGVAIKYFLAVVKGLLLVLFPSRYPELLVLEMGADKPGDIAYLVDIAKPYIAVLTGIGETHLEMFGSVEQVAREKKRLINALSDEGVAIINHDDQIARQIGHEHNGRLLSYGLQAGAHLRASALALKINEQPLEQQFDRAVGATTFTAASTNVFGTGYLVNALGRAHIYSALAALAVAKALSLDLQLSLEALRQYQAPAGRMHLLWGIKRTILIDDSYNSSPQAAVLALETLQDLATQGRKWAVLGDMLELGVRTEEYHRSLGERIRELKLDFLITVGERAHHIAHAAISAGQDQSSIFEFAEASEAGRFLQDRIHERDIILIKGSRGVHLEVLVKEIMAEPQRAAELLVH